MRYAHTCIRVKDLDASLDFYKNALGYKEVQRLDYPEDKFTLVYLQQEEGEGQLELTYNYAHPAYDLGNGYGHIGLYTDDLNGEYERIKKAGYEPGDFGKLSGDDEPRFFFVKDPDGYYTEIINANYYK